MGGKAVGWTRGMLTGPRRQHPGGIGRPDVTSVVVPDTKQQELATDRLSGVGAEALLWLSDDGTRPQLRCDQMMGLQQALFLLRANFLDVLYVHRCSDMHPDDRALVAAEVLACGKRLIVAGELVTSPAQLDDRPEMVELATAGAKLRAQAAGRSVENGGPPEDDEWLDIGVIDSAADAARLAHKLRTELRTPPELIARLLDEASYECGRKQWSGAAVKRLLADAPHHVTVVSRDEAWGASRPVLAGMKVDVAYVPAGWDQSVPDVFQVLKQDTAGAKLPTTTYLVTLLRMGVIARLVIPDSAVLNDEVNAALLLGEARAAGAGVSVADTLLGVANVSDSVAGSAVVAARLHRALRFHDTSTVTTDLEALAATELMSWEESVGKETDRRRAQYLARLAIPTRKGTGTWSASAARRFRS